MNENEFEHDGKVYVAVDGTHNGCEKCAFENRTAAFCDEKLPGCFPAMRADNRYVIFIEKQGE